jgi:hypothetical protein
MFTTFLTCNGFINLFNVCPVKEDKLTIHSKITGICRPAFGALMILYSANSIRCMYDPVFETFIGISLFSKYVRVTRLVQ